MSTRKRSPLQAAFQLTTQERRLILLLCLLALIGLAARWYYLERAMTGAAGTPRKSPMELNDE